LTAEKVGSDVIGEKTMPDTRAYTQHDKEQLKKKMLMFVCKSNSPVTPSEIAEELELVYPTACILLLELALEGHLKLKVKGKYRFFFPAPELTAGLTVIKR
jgi:hypothetical protein